MACAALTLFGQNTEPLDSAALSSSQPAPATDTLAQQDAALAAPNPSVVANCSLCIGLISSTGNLYFTSFGFNEFYPDSTSFYRTGKTSLPGSEGLLYRETNDSPGPNYLGNVVWAKPDTFYGYLVANYTDSDFRFSQIKRVPLAGGDAITLATSPGYIGNKDLLTDGTRLFWVDAGGIRSLSIYGGAVQTLLVSSSVSRISLDSKFVYYAEGNGLSRLPKSGGAATGLFSAPDTITAVYARQETNSTAIFWGERGGAVRVATLLGLNTPYVFQPPVAGREVRAVGFDGIHGLWIDCTQPGNSSCSVKMRTGGSATTVLDGGVGAYNLQWDANNIFWTNVSSVMKYSH
jgi:hypothetical protein